MALMKKTQRSFAGGQLDKDLTGRQDLNKYSQGCLTLENFKVRKQGNVIKRSGTDLVCDFSRCLGNLATDTIGTAKLVPLIQERESGYYILFTGKRAFLISPAGMRMTNGTWDPNPIWSGSASWTADNAPSGHAFNTQPTHDTSTGTWTWTDTVQQTWTAEGAAKDVRLTFKETIISSFVSNFESSQRTLTFTSTRTTTSSTDWTSSAAPSGHTFTGQPTRSNTTWTWTDTGGCVWTATGASTVKTLNFSTTVTETVWTSSAAPSGHTFSGQPTYSDGKWTWTDDSDTTWTATGTSSATTLTFSFSQIGTTSFEATYGNDASNTAPYSIAIPFDDADLAMLDWCQSGDTVFFAHRSYPPGRLVYANGSLAYSRIEFRQGTGNPPRISSVVPSGTGWTGTGGTIHLEYAVTAVKDGVETEMSTPYAVEYGAPWPTTGSYIITIDTSGMDEDSCDCFYIYKKEADVFGLVGTTSNQKAFVDVSGGFSVDGTLYPAGFTTFDRQVHLRESGNKFASVTVTTDETVRTTRPKFVLISNWSLVPQKCTVGCGEGNASAFSVFTNSKKTKTRTTQGSTSRSATAQKTSVANGESMQITYGFNAVRMTSFTLGIGSLCHNVTRQNSEVADDVYYYQNSSGYYYWATVADTKVTVGDTKWIGSSSSYASSAAKHYQAKLFFDDGTQSEWFGCDASVDQSNPGSGWTRQGSTNVWRKEYEEGTMFSYEDASSVMAMMDANAPGVGATVSFKDNFPATAKTMNIVQIRVRGYADSSCEESATFIANRLTCYKDGTYVNTFTDGYYTPDLTITPPKTEDHFVNPGEYPGCVQLYSQRLVYASSANYPFTFWMSQTGDLYNFDSHEYIRASDAISASTAALEMPRINRMLVHRDLMLFSEGGEWQVAPSAGNAVAPSTIAAKLQSTVGCASWLKPIPVDSDIIFCDSSGETLMATRYNFASDGYESSNLSVLSQRIFRNNPIVAMAYAQFPESTIECVLSDGTIASLVYMKEHEVCAWSKHVLGGSWKAVDVAANKSVAFGSSNCAFVAKRTYDVMNGNTASTQTDWAVLAIRDIDPNDSSLLGNLRMDAVRSVAVARTDGQPGAAPTPGHGETVVKVGETRTTTEDVTTVTADVYAVGCAFASVLKTTSPEFTDQETAQMEIKNATESEIRVIDGSDFTVRKDGVPAEKATQMKVPYTLDVSGETYTLITGDADCKLPLVGTNTMNGSVIIEHDGYLPLAILSVSTAFRIEYSNHANGGSQNGRD